MAESEICKTLKEALRDEYSAPDIYYKLVRLGVSQPKMASIVKQEDGHAKILEKLITQYRCSRIRRK